MLLILVLHVGLLLCFRTSLHCSWVQMTGSITDKDISVGIIKWVMAFASAARDQLRHTHVCAFHSAIFSRPSGRHGCMSRWLERIAAHIVLTHRRSIRALCFLGGYRMWEPWTIYFRLKVRSSGKQPVDHHRTDCVQMQLLPKLWPSRINEWVRLRCRHEAVGDGSEQAKVRNLDDDPVAQPGKWYLKTLSSLQRTQCSIYRFQHSPGTSDN